MIDLPPFCEGQRIGLFGGSFNPAHRGHYMVALYALKRLRLDWVVVARFAPESIEEQRRDCLL